MSEAAGISRVLAKPIGIGDLLASLEELTHPEITEACTSQVAVRI